MKKWLLIFALLIPLYGCVPAALVVGAAAGGALIYDNRPVRTVLADRHAAQTAQNIMNEDRILRKKAHISIAVFNHVALMVGQARTATVRQRAYNFVRGVKGINRVYNEVTIGKPTSLARRADDTWITTKVKTAFLAEKGLHSTQMKVVTENGVVYLLGLVSKRQAELAANRARRIPGVKKVVKVFQYT